MDGAPGRVLGIVPRCSLHHSDDAMNVVFTDDAEFPTGIFAASTADPTYGLKSGLFDEERVTVERVVIGTFTMGE